MTSARSILIWGNDNILSSSIELFLDAQGDWDVVNLPGEDDLAILIQAVETTQPDIVIINRKWRSSQIDLPLRFLKDHPGIKVITVNLEDNALEVYSKQEFMVKQTSDLIAVIENSI